MHISRLSMTQKIAIPDKKQKTRIHKNISNKLSFGSEENKFKNNSAKSFLLALFLLFGGNKFSQNINKKPNDFNLNEVPTESVATKSTATEIDIKNNSDNVDLKKVGKPSLISAKEQMQIMSQKANEEYEKVSAKLLNEQEQIKNATKPVQEKIINDGIKTARDFEKELKNTINSYITKWQKDNPGKNIYKVFGSSLSGHLITNIKIEHNGQKFDVSFCDEQIQKIKGKFSNTDEATGNYTSGSFEYDYTKSYDNYKYSTVTTQGSDGRCLFSLDVSNNANNISVTNYTSLPDGSGENIECEFEKSQNSIRNKYCKTLFSKDNQILERIGYYDCTTNKLEGSSLITVSVTETLDNKGNIIYRQSKKNPSTGDGNIMIVKLDDKKRQTVSAKQTKSCGEITEKIIGYFTYLGNTNLYQTENTIEFYPVKKKFCFNNVDYVLGTAPEGNKMNYIISINRESLDNAHAYKYTVINEPLYTNLSIKNNEIFNNKNEIIGTKLYKKTEINASDKIGQHTIITTPDKEIKQIIDKNGERKTQTTDLTNIQKLDGIIDDLQQREIGDCALHITLSLLCKNENMNFCNNNIGEIELANGIKIPVSTITKRDDGSVIVSMYNEEGKLYREIVTKEELENPTYKVPGEIREITLSEGDRDIKAIEIGAIKIYGWKTDEKTGMKTPAFTNGEIGTWLMKLTGNRYFQSENIDIFNPKNIGKGFYFITYAKAGSSNGDTDTYDMIDKDGIMRTLDYFHAYEAVMNSDGTITLINPHNGRDFCFTFTAQELNKFPGYYAFYTTIAPELEKLLPK